MKSKHVAEKPVVVTSLRMTFAEHEALKRVAARESRTVSGQLRHIIKTLAADESKAVA